MSEWQPIETAPKDGRSILVMRNIEPGFPRRIAQDCWAGNTAVAEWWQEDGDGEWLCYMDKLQELHLHFDPTHWMPLPKPPRD